MGPKVVDLRSLGRVAVFSRGISKIPDLAELIGASEIVCRPKAGHASELDAVIGWGHKPTAKAARAYAATHALPYVRLEDGFLRSANVGDKGDPLSVVVDDIGIYYDASCPSRLETWLNEPDEDSATARDLVRRAALCRQRIIEAKLSKYNNT